ncbi:MAG: hypothetical protein ACPGOV_14295 [Magnetovibrionaceae bacterium]
MAKNWNEIEDVNSETLINGFANDLSLDDWNWAEGDMIFDEDFPA